MKAGLLLILIAGLLSSCNVSVYSNYSRSTDFSKYKSFSWIKGASDSPNKYFGDEKIQDDIIKYANNYLYSVGYELEPKNPDLLVTYHTQVNREMITVNTPIYDYTPSGPRLVGYKKEDIPHITAKVVIEIIDKKTNQQIWCGWGESSISNANDVDRQLHGEINRIMAKYPVKPQKNSPTYSTYQK
jgi:hypothetical protein